jgi:hypothetical protein
MDAAPAHVDNEGRSGVPALRPIGRFWRVLLLLGLAQRQPDAVRLASDVEGLRAWLYAHRCALPGGGGVTQHSAGAATGTECPATHGEAVAGAPSWRERRFQLCRDYLDLATKAAHANHVASGYEYLHIAEREAVFLMSPVERQVRAQSLRAEAGSNDKFGNSWRTQAILGLLKAGRNEAFSADPPSEADADISPEALAEAVEHRNTLYRNEHRKTDKTRWQLAWLGLIVGALVLLAFAVVLLAPLPADLARMNLLPHCIYLGLLGGFVSSAITQRTADRKVSVPEIEVSFYAAMARGALGAATSIPVFILVKAGLVTVAGATEATASWGLLFLCFLAGFSERWFLSAVTSVARDDKKEDKPR